MADHFKNFDELFRDEREPSRPQRPPQRPAQPARRRPQQQGRKPSAANAHKPEVQSASTGDTSTLKKILKSPLKWIKSIGKKD